ncbi:PaaI family thioesterase [Vibrio sp. JC009]|uniref:PaaI family thioesterase n=1 Tax=Vibrio sp. JC009 TaxID=2912314 RepID=UPI0023AE9177|nr:PaaI family thioesterase [Vibrio sp. JC009]WED23824.1 PaaI family thioesterase [Vibrio sp. JC009]
MKRYKTAKQAHAHCMVCGDEDNNPDALQLSFESDGEKSVRALFDVTPRHQGYSGLLHGGMTSTLLDAAMTHCLFTQGVKALTAELVVRFMEPIKVGEQVTVSASLTGQRRGIYQLEALISTGQKALARASAKFIEPK